MARGTGRPNATRVLYVTVNRGTRSSSDAGAKIAVRDAMAKSGLQIEDVDALGGTLRTSVDGRD